MERYEILKRTYREEYLKDCPLLLINSGLTYDREKNEVLAQFKFQNLGHKIIKAVYVKIFCSGPGNEPLENAAQFIYLDLSVQSLAIFGGDIPISLPNNRTRNVLLTCTKIVFVDETVWCNEENKNYNPLPPKQPLQRCLNEELYEELLTELSEERVVCQDVYFPCELENIRFCPCGTYYLKEDTVCPCCQKEYEWWTEITLKEKLEKNLEIRREKEQGKTILITTHNMQDAAELCDRVAFIVNGKIMALDSPHNLIMSRGAARVTYTWIDQGEQQADCPLDALSQDKRLQTLIMENRLQSIHSSEPTLNDIFIDITGRTLV